METFQDKTVRMIFLIPLFTSDQKPCKHLDHRVDGRIGGAGGVPLAAQWADPGVADS